MTLESTILCVDNSDYMRNGDYIPTRALAQQDAVNMICHTKVRSNPENNVGLITMADKQVLVTLTTDTGKIMNQMHLVQPKGNIDFLTSLKIAHLALKHRQGRNHKMKIIVFVGSPITMDDKEMLKLAKKLKKEKVNVDIISFGETENNNELLNNFIETLNGKEGTGSHLVTIPPGPVLSEALLTSPIMIREDGTSGMPSMSSSSAGAMMLGGEGSDFEFGIDPSTDPELALALRVSMEEQRARQEAEARAANQRQVESAVLTSLSDDNQTVNLATNQSIMASDATLNDNKTNLRIASTGPMLDIDNVDTNQQEMTEEELLLQQALAMSMGIDPSLIAANTLGGHTKSKPKPTLETIPDQRACSDSQQPMERELTEEEEINLAIQLSLQKPTSSESDQTNLRAERMETDEGSPKKKEDSKDFKRKE